ncbi:hypothetical protein R7P34_25590, partial [Vibrio sp. 780]
QLICIGLHTNPRVKPQGQQVLDNLKTVLPSWDIHCCQVSQGFELCIGMILEKGYRWDDSIRMDADF